MARDKRGLDYSVQLPDIDAPVKGRGGELTIAAGQTEGAGKAAQGAAVAKGISFLGTAALEAYKGSLEAGVQKDTKDAMKKLAGVGSEAVEAQKNLDTLRRGKFAEEVT